MGILGFSKLLADVAPHAIKEMELKHYFGKLLFQLILQTLYCSFSVSQLNVIE